MTRLSISRTFLILTLLFTATVATADGSFDRQNKKKDQFFLRSSNIEAVAQQYGLTVIRSIGSPSGDLWLVRAPEGSTPSELLALIQADEAVEEAEDVVLAGLPALNLAGSQASATQAANRSGTVNTPCLDTHMPSAWSGYSDQEFTQKIQLAEAQQYAGCGEGITVAVIDTGVDVDHPHLQGAMVAGYDFINEAPSFSATEAGLDVRTLAIVESSETALLAGASAPVQLANSVVLLGSVDSDAEMDLQKLPPYYGHGTMTAGLIRAVAPGAKIMPLVAFDDDGNGHPFDIIRAVYYAVDNGAKVINMSFSMDEFSLELGLALEYARANGVIPVAAAGNQGSLASAYPASFASSIGVASTDWEDQLTDFSNYGIYTADLTAPGNDLVTLFPHGGYAVGWGTSFSTPMVAGTVALIRDLHHGNNKATHKNTRLHLLQGAIYKDYLWDWVFSGGRLNAFGAVIYSY